MNDDSSGTETPMMRLLLNGWKLLFDALEPLSTDDQERHVTIRGEQLTVVQAITRQLSHYAWHVGQIVILAKHHAGDAWETLSIARGESDRYNERKQPYL